MEAKDWVLLFVPIISNGLIVFLIQFLVTEKYKKRQEKRQIQNDIYKHFYGLLQSLNTGSLEMHLHKNALIDFDNDIKGKNSAMEQVVIYFNSNLKLFLDINWRMNDIKQSWNDIYSLWEEQKPFLIKGKTTIKPSTDVYVQFFDLIIVWQAATELMKSCIIDKL